ncbi:hypothetical protein [Gallaecimonas sp. GXIMD1310]|uniref:hypothetical protein n=1 Tax=Gallaecimonas sp. GXIMD1310 TaxID=3131926 RepID=UPI003252D116
MKLHNEKILLSFSVILFYFIFQTFLVFTAVSLKGNCLNQAWLTSPLIISPFAIFVETVFLLLIFGITLGYSKLKSGENIYANSAYYIVFVIVLSLWLNGLHGMWRMFQYEKGKIKASEYYSEQFFHWAKHMSPHQCKVYKYLISNY